MQLVAVGEDADDVDPADAAPVQAEGAQEPGSSRRRKTGGI